MLNEKVAVVTGSTSGIGLGIARALAMQGCRVVLNGRRQTDETESLRAEIAAASGTDAIFRRADMSKPDDIRAMMEAVADELGPADILVNNAGVQHVAPIQDFSSEAWDMVLATNLSSAFHCTKAVLPAMKKRGWGRIINIASAHGLVASPFKSAYVAAKHGMLGLTKVTALETAEEGITCNAICPGYVWTPLIEKQIEDQARSHGIAPERVINEVLLAPQPTKQFVTVEECAALAVFLASDAAKSITGAAIPVEGGWTAR